uniref:Phosphoglycolate phosphatase n=1 Tax=Aplanochytrium stocchinoi TaxID=215587 RepID=A0A7S3LPB0_9STRA|mmetsp:Transcript_20295/g.24601  ORF Transcript_20295/g.24601 Transcript_20295/m.24601 type:complete len:304 (+) Transcript_20295:159-1070(+)|eukprot:CAMPEP_0204825960 /NCGR_PEP_ID=MMETSP1346-20131115/3738_1 /ASSEMBLY_ACC=CAM_ASM_000771 /TAXON_ID=215587 /ORGANISM="Aplanochytrium stocchinoi, Strain GSBS06" /LENGTH=303 /DNA_ID=CAMNT_0051953769 /DNA_START=576 /DNA_END=1487 /DNA_ORIENTATION=-
MPGSRRIALLRRFPYLFQSPLKGTDTKYSNTYFKKSQPLKVRMASTFISGRKPKLVIFDKDGTLIDFDFMWASWTEKLAKDIEELINAKNHTVVEQGAVTEEIFNQLGYDSANRTVKSGGKLCCSPMGEIRGVIKSLLSSKFSLSDATIEEILDNTYGTPTPNESNVRTLGNLKDTFTMMREKYGLKIAVCTTDDHEPTKEMLRLQGALHLVDVIVGGDDVHIPPKPSPEQIKHICDKVNVLPEHAVMVGDTNTDMAMGKSANVLLTIGMMHGASSIVDLEPNADVLVPSFHKFEQLLHHICS